MIIKISNVVTDQEAAVGDIAEMIKATGLRRLPSHVLSALKENRAGLYAPYLGIRMLTWRYCSVKPPPNSCCMISRESIGRISHHGGLTHSHTV